MDTGIPDLLTRRMPNLINNPDYHPQLCQDELRLLLTHEAKTQELLSTQQSQINKLKKENSLLTESLDRVHAFLPKTKDGVPIAGQPLYLHEDDGTVLECSRYASRVKIVTERDSRYAWYYPSDFTYEKDFPVPGPVDGPIAEQSNPSLARRRR